MLKCLAVAGQRPLRQTLPRCSGSRRGRARTLDDKRARGRNEGDWIGMAFARGKADSKADSSESTLGPN
jgi:hypothetical protein